LEANPIGAVIALLTGLVQIFSQNKEVADQVSFAIAGLNKGFGFIIDTIVNTVSSFDNLTEAITHPIKFLSKLASGTAQAAKEGYNASKAFDELTVANAKLNAEISVGQEKSDALTKSLKDRTKTEQERIKIANQIADLEVSNAQKLAKLRADELNALNLQNKNRTLSGEEQAKVIEKQGEVEVAQLQAITAENQRQTRINILLEKEATANIKDTGDEKAKLRQKELAEFKQTQSDLADLISQSVSDEKDLYDQQIKNINQHNAAIAQLGINAQLQLDLSKTTGESQQQLDEEFAASSYQTFAEFYAAKKKLYEDDVANQKEATKQKQEIDSAYLSFSSSIANGLIGFIGDVAAATGANAAFAKGLALFQIGINTAVALTGAILQAQSVPFPANLVAIGTGIGAVLGGIGSAISILNKSGNPPATPKFATGVIGLDGAGTETSDSIGARLSKGESVLTAKATRKYHRQLAYMEMSVGNKPNYQFGGGMFAGGFIPSVSGDGGFLARAGVSSEKPLSRVIRL
jgi:hypothetical protein